MSGSTETFYISQLSIPHGQNDPIIVLMFLFVCVFKSIAHTAEPLIVYVLCDDKMSIYEGKHSNH